jgi:MFS family permease
VIARLRKTYLEFPSKFWVLVGATFIDRVGGTMVFPFFALYVTQRFSVGMTQAGALLAIFSVAGFFGNMVGGALADKVGRRAMLLFGLVFSAASSVSMGLANSLALMTFLAAVVGLLSDVAGPAQNAMVADLLPEGQRAEGYGILRVAGNLAWIFGPTIAGLLAARSYLLLFVMDAITSLITATIVFRLIPETRPGPSEEAPQESLGHTFRGYIKVLADGGFVAFLLASVLMNLVYIQLYSTLSVFLRDVHNISTQGYGFLMSLNASLVVVAQFWVTRRTRRYPELFMMALGSALYMIGFSMFGLVSTFFMFGVSMLIVTTGEMVAIPVAQALAAKFAPQEMRGRYMAIFSISWGIPAAIGPWAAGLILDNYNPNMVWYLGGALAALGSLAFIFLQWKTGQRLRQEPQLALGD